MSFLRLDFLPRLGEGVSLFVRMKRTRQRDSGGPHGKIESRLATRFSDHRNNESQSPDWQKLASRIGVVDSLRVAGKHTHAKLRDRLDPG